MPDETDNEEGKRSGPLTEPAPSGSDMASKPDEPSGRLTVAEEAGEGATVDVVKNVTTQPVRRRVERFTRKAPPIPLWRLIVPALGMALFVGCLWALIGTDVRWPSWHLWPSSGVGVVDTGLVIIDPGHGGEDSGAVAQGVVEKDLNLDVGMRVGRALSARGVGVRLTREDDHFVPLEDRVRFANGLPGAVFVSIHFNDAAGEGKTNAQASGIETYYCEHKLSPADGWVWASLVGRGTVNIPNANWAVHEGQTLADCIQGALIAGTQAENRGIKERSLYVTHRVLGPAVLVEGGFVSHPGEARLLGDANYRQVLAESITEGIIKYLRTAQPAPPTTVVTGA